MKAILNIEKVVTNIYGVSLEDIMSRKRFKPMVNARRAYCFLLKYVLDWSYPMIGRHFKYDHSSIIHLVQTFDRKDFKKRCRAIGAHIPAEIYRILDKH